MSFWEMTYDIYVFSQYYPYGPWNIQKILKDEGYTPTPGKAVINNAQPPVKNSFLAHACIVRQ